MISVVVPVYNGDEFLDDCLRSIEVQTYVNWKCTIVDNASTDRTAEIADRTQRRDPRFKHLRYETFVSAAENHNRAFDVAMNESDWCKLVQADDLLFADCLRLMVEAVAGRPTVGVVSAYQLWGRRLHLYGLPHDVALASGREILRASLLGEYNVTGGPTATLVRSAALQERRPFYQPGLRHDDTDAMLWLLSRYDLAFVHQVLTFARQQSGSRYAWSYRLGSQNAEDILFVLRYGRDVLTPSIYRARLRNRLARYVWWHVRQLPKPSRLVDTEFFELHEHERALILRAADGDREVEAAMAIVGALLARKSLGRLHRNVPTHEADLPVADAARS